MVQVSPAIEQKWLSLASGFFLVGGDAKEQVEDGNKS
jgi:hypothetical protein